MIDSKVVDAARNAVLHSLPRQQLYSANRITVTVQIDDGYSVVIVKDRDSLGSECGHCSSWRPYSSEREYHYCCLCGR